MPVPTHGPFCQTLVYPTSCWYCQQQIHVLQCSCGSAVLFDEIGPPWLKHECTGTGGIGGSGLSGWEAVDTLRALGAPISHDVIKKIFPGGQPGGGNSPSISDIEKIEPTADQTKDLLAVVRELHTSANRISAIDDLSTMGRKLLGLDPNARYWQITLVQNNVRPNGSFTALIPEYLVRDLKKDMMVMASMSARRSR